MCVGLRQTVVLSRVSSRLTRQSKKDILPLSSSYKLRINRVSSLLSILMVKVERRKCMLGHTTSCKPQGHELHKVLIVSDGMFMLI